MIRKGELYVKGIYNDLTKLLDKAPAINEHFTKKRASSIIIIYE
jgi:hypothetical protein